MKTYLASLLFLICCIGIKAQESSTKNESSGKFYLLGGVHFINTDNLNSRLTANENPELGSLYSSYGVGASWQTGRWIFGGEAMSLSGSETDGPFAENINISATVGLGYFYAGYAVVDAGKFRLIPRLGIGGSGITVLINEKAETTLDDYLEGRSANNLRTGGALVHGSIKLGWMLSEHWDLNLDLGYNHAFEGEWDTSFGALTESVKDGIGGAYAQLAIGYIINL